ncbi:MAG TPA: hypothetical protein VM513_33260 [Kofleriaceae bacterium]|nr:hypothetical protein [Kofleriaceae bacterium]
MTLRLSILRALERCSSAALDNDEERDVVADAVLAELRMHPDAHLIRSVFTNAPTGGGKLIVMRTIGGKRESLVLSAAARLAQCDEVTP